MLIELFIASRVNKAADSLRRVAEADDYHSGIDAFERFLAYGRKKRMDKMRIEEQLHGKKMTDDGEEEILD